MQCRSPDKVLGLPLGSEVLGRRSGQVAEITS
jgi:hypothetical protein